MRYEKMTKEQLINELGKLQRHITKLEILKDKYKQSLKEIESLEQKMEFILGVTNTRMDIIDSEFNIHYVDRESQKIYGDPKGKRCYEYSLGRNEPCLDCQIVKAMSTKSHIVSERILPMENNRPVQVITVPFQNDKGEWFVAEIKVDITERKKAEKALRDSETKFRILSEKSPNMIFINKQGKVVYANKRCEEIMGYQKEEFYSPDFDFRCLIAPEYREIIKKNFNKHMKGEEVSPIEYTNITKEGKRIESMLATKLIAYEGDKAILGIVTDITKLKEAERILKRDKETFERLVNEKTQELLKIQKQLSDAKRLSDIGLLAASIAHELNQPLTAIMSNAQAMQRIMASRNPDMAEIHEIVSDIIKEDRRASDIIRESRTLLKRSELNLEQLNINDVIKEIIPLIHSEVIIKKVLLKLDLDEGIPPVRGDRIQLQQVILNLIANGMEAMNNVKSKNLIIRTEQTTNLTVRVSVEDSGTGVDENHIADIFEPFYTTTKDGMGMGLAIVHSIIDTHGGKLWAKNNPDHGTTFFFTVPVAMDRSDQRK